MGDAFNEFMDRKREEFARRRVERGGDEYSARLRFRIDCRLNVDSEQHEFPLQGVQAVLSSSSAGVPISQSDWLVLKASFQDPSEAVQWILRVQDAVALGALRQQSAVDVGPTNVASIEALQEQAEMADKHGIAGANEVHGSMVCLAGAFLVSGGSATILVGRSVEAFFGAVDTAMIDSGHLDDRHRNAVLMLNAAKMSDEPIARLTLSVGAVEILAHEKNWSEGQAKLLAELEDAVTGHGGLPPEELVEIASAISRLRNLSVGEGQRRLLRDVGLAELLKPWKDLYGRRSSILHGDDPAVRADVRAAAIEAIELSTAIVLRAVAARAGVLPEKVPGG